MSFHLMLRSFPLFLFLQQKKRAPNFSHLSLENTRFHNRFLDAMVTLKTARCKNHTSKEVLEGVELPGYCQPPILSYSHRLTW